jgi:pimeloyl-ACP methyl ester carboxylesterase
LAPDTAEKKHAMTDTTRRDTMVTLAAIAAGSVMSGPAQSQQAGGPLGGGPLAAGASGPFTTQPWLGGSRLQMAGYAVERVTFPSQHVPVVGNLFLPSGEERKPAIVVIGPVGFVKEQAPLQYASRLVHEGYVTLIFDPRFHGESGGEPRRFESGAEKVKDLSAAVDFLAQRPDVDPARIHVLGVCQGVNWTIEAAILDSRIRAISVVAGHYLTPEVATMYLGTRANVEARFAKSQASEARYRDSGQVDYINIVSPSLAQPDPNALLTAPPIQMFYIRWADRSPFLAHRGLWENRLTAMSEHLIWGHRIDHAVPKLRTPTLMIHADRAASGIEIPRKLFTAMPAEKKELVWLGGQGQLQFYEDPLTIEQAVPHIARFFA